MSLGIELWENPINIWKLSFVYKHTETSYPLPLLAEVLSWALMLLEECVII